MLGRGVSDFNDLIDFGFRHDKRRRKTKNVAMRHRTRDEPLFSRGLCNTGTDLERRIKSSRALPIGRELYGAEETTPRTSPAVSNCANRSLSRF